MKKYRFIVTIQDTPDVVKRLVGVVQGNDGDELLVFVVGIKNTLEISSKYVRSRCRKNRKTSGVVEKHIHEKYVISVIYLKRIVNFNPIKGVPMV